MLRFRRSKVLPIGLDLGHDSVKLLQLEVQDQQLSVLAAARQPLPEEARQDASLRTAAAMDLLRRMLRSGQFVGRHVVAALPREIIHVKNLRLPHMPAAELPAAVQFEANNIFSFEPDSAQVRFLHAGEVRQGADVREEVIVLSAKNDQVNDFVEQLHRAGAIIDSLDFETAAIYRSLERFIRRREDENEVNVMVDIGAARTQVIIGRGRNISFFKPVDIGGQHLNGDVARKLGITHEEARSLRRRLIESAGESATRKDPVRQAVCDATRSIIEDLAREISLCLRYYSVTFRGQRPARVRVLGGEACDPNLQAILNANLPVPVEPLRPLALVNTDLMKQADRRGCLSEWAAALGLGLKLTEERFTAPSQATSQLRTSVAEVIDLSRALQLEEAPGA
jgi:type IV pilus assembly protein PilM